MYPETLHKEYAKASKRLNIFTKFSNVVSGKDDADELRLQEKMSEMAKLRQDIITETAIKKKEEIFTKKKQYEMLNSMQKQIDNLSGNISRDNSKSVEFCCVQCSTIHNKPECLACGAKLKRIYA